MKKFTVKISAFLAAAMCAVMLFGTVVSAAAFDPWKSIKEITGASYSSKYIKLVGKCSAKDTDTNTDYKSSRTKKYFTKLSKKYKNAKEDTVQFKVSVASKEDIISYTRKGMVTRNAILADNPDENIRDSYIYIFTPEQSDSLLFVNGAVFTDTNVGNVAADGNTFRMDYDGWYNVFLSYFPSVDFVNGLDIKDSVKGKSLKIKSGGKTYYYEEFETEAYGKAGYLFTEKDALAAIYYGGNAYCVNIRTSVKDSEFKVPDKYKAE